MYVCGGGGDSAAGKKNPVPQSGFQTARSLLQALVSSRKQSSSCMHFGFLRSCGKLRAWPLNVRCLRRAAVKVGHCMITCSMVWRGSLHWQAI